jgi:hypothetical protein
MMPADKSNARERDWGVQKYSSVFVRPQDIKKKKT